MAKASLFIQIRLAEFILTSAVTFAKQFLINKETSAKQFFSLGGYGLARRPSARVAMSSARAKMISAKQISIRKGTSAKQIFFLGLWLGQAAVGQGGHVVRQSQNDFCQAVFNKQRDFCQTVFFLG